MPTILWDWNGTLVDDVALTVQINREVFESRGYPPVTVEAYRRMFRFPVRDYYRDLGVSDADFPEVAAAWNTGYMQTFGPQVPLFPDAVETVRRFREAGFRQAIVSLSRHDQLLYQIRCYPGLEPLFDEICGTRDFYADSKVAMALDFMRRFHADPADTVFLGDTCHDAEVAGAIGCRCILIRGGHQADSSLAGAHAELADSRRSAADRLLSSRKEADSSV